MMSLPELAVRRPITTVMVLVSVMVLGGIAVTRLPLAFLPEIDVPFIHVEIPHPDSNPSQIEKEIAKPVEEVLATLSGVTKTTPYSMRWRNVTRFSSGTRGRLPNSRGDG